MRRCDEHRLDEVVLRALERKPELRYQQASALSQWFWRRFGTGSPRVRRIGIVALARKLLVALWKYVERDEVPLGAVIA